MFFTLAFRSECVLQLRHVKQICDCMAEGTAMCFVYSCWVYIQHTLCVHSPQFSAQYKDFLNAHLILTFNFISAQLITFQRPVLQ
jgi:hypothetical protein